ncbi:MAG TPA: peptidase C39 family protein [Rubrobacter sp.]|nr:peptidase C39 family protein [Rubrobacter sp.]
MRGITQFGSWPERVVAAALLLVCLLLCVSGEAKAASGSYISFGDYDTHRALAAGTEKGVTIRKGSVRLARGRSQGTLTSRVYRSAHKDTFIPSWNAHTPSGTWLRMEMRVRSGGNWTRWWDMGVWAKGTDTIKRHSVNGQRAGDWRVLTDTLQSIGPVFADAYQYRLTLLSKRERRTPSVGAIYVTASNSYRNGDAFVGPNENLWGKDLSVPARSQMIYPNGGEVWCSPTSLSMVMAYWAKKKNRGSLNQKVPTVAHGTYDYVYRGNGNWPFNTAYASTYGLKASVNRFSSLGQVERWISKGVPIVASISWGRDELAGAPIPASSGHLLVIRGFTKAGDVKVNDPAASGNSGVKRVYQRDEFYRAWFKSGSGGVAYVVRPEGWPVPDRTYAHGSW